MVVSAGAVSFIILEANGSSNCRRKGGGGGAHVHTHTQINAGTESWERGGWARQAAGQALFCGVFMASPSSGISDTWKGSRCCFFLFYCVLFFWGFLPHVKCCFFCYLCFGLTAPTCAPVLTDASLFSPTFDFSCGETKPPRRRDWPVMEQ